jgi:hypothetical protein
MNRLTRFSVVTVIILALLSNAVSAQFVVHDPTNYAQALARYGQLVQQYRHFVAQARRLPDVLAARYRVPTPRWRTHDLGDTYAYARSILTALNRGDSSGTGYASSIDRLTDLTEVLPLLPADLRRRLTNTYATIQLADSVARYAIDQTGRVRDNGGAVLAAVLNMENDATSFSDDLHTQIAVLNKINGANVLGLRIGEMGNQLQMHVLEQVLVQNKRTRDTEAQLMNARLFQWRYGPAYGRDLFSRSAANLETWRQP